MKKAALGILFIAIVALVGGSRLWRLYDPHAIHAQKQTELYLVQSVKLSQLSHLLVDSLGVVQNKKTFEWAATMLGWRSFQPGHYCINQDFTYNKFLSKLARGNQDAISLTIVPGQQEHKIASFLYHSMRFDSADIYNALADTSIIPAVKKTITETIQSKVGYLFPATYQWYWTSPATKIVKSIYEQFNQQIGIFYHQHASDSTLSLNKILTLASIIEGEAIHDDEKPTISGLYWNRLNANMYLQADPTVNFAVKKKRRLYFKDYKVESPYNTYIHKGLPPGPINNPSLSSVKAAMMPQKNDFLFMVAKPDGYHAFSKTYAEHQKQSQKWRQYLDEQTQKAKQDSTR